MLYNEFIQNIIDTRGRFNCGSEYHERHHIIPRCMGGDNSKENLIDLYANEHYVAHKLLYEENKNIIGLAYAYCKMAYSSKIRDFITPEEYEKAKILKSNIQKNKKMTAETRKKISESHKGIPKSEEHRKKLSIANTGKKQPKEVIEKRVKTILERQPLKGKPLSEQTKQKMKDVWKDTHKFTQTEEFADKMRKLHSGTNNPTYGKKYTEEQKQHIKDGLKKYYSNHKSHNAKTVMCMNDGKIFNGIKEASKYYNLPYSNLCQSIKNNVEYHNYRFIVCEGGEQL